MESDAVGQLAQTRRDHTYAYQWDATDTENTHVAHLENGIATRENISTKILEVRICLTSQLIARQYEISQLDQISEGCRNIASSSNLNKESKTSLRTVPSAYTYLDVKQKQTLMRVIWWKRRYKAGFILVSRHHKTHCIGIGLIFAEDRKIEPYQSTCWHAVSVTLGRAICQNWLGSRLKKAD